MVPTPFLTDTRHSKNGEGKLNTQSYQWTNSLCRLSEHGNCNTCNTDEDITYALVTCTLNKSFWSFIIWLIQQVFYKHVDIGIDLLIKNNEFNETDDLVTIAFWSIYKSILIRNYKGVDNRQSCLKYLFASELRKRLEVNKFCAGKPLFVLPNELLYKLLFFARVLFSRISRAQTLAKISTSIHVYL